MKSIRLCVLGLLAASPFAGMQAAELPFFDTIIWTNTAAADIPAKAGSDQQSIADSLQSKSGTEMLPRSSFGGIQARDSITDLTDRGFIIQITDVMGLAGQDFRLTEPKDGDFSLTLGNRASTGLRRHLNIGVGPSYEGAASATATIEMVFTLSETAAVDLTLLGKRDLWWSGVVGETGFFRAPLSDLPGSEAITLSGSGSVRISTAAGAEIASHSFADSSEVPSPAASSVFSQLVLAAGSYRVQLESTTSGAWIPPVFRGDVFYQLESRIVMNFTDAPNTWMASGGSITSFAQVSAWSKEAAPIAGEAVLLGSGTSTMQLDADRSQSTLRLTQGGSHTLDLEGHTLALSADLLVAKGELRLRDGTVTAVGGTRVGGSGPALLVLEAGSRLQGRVHVEGTASNEATLRVSGDGAVSGVAVADNGTFEVRDGATLGVTEGSSFDFDVNAASGPALAKIIGAGTSVRTSTRLDVGYDDGTGILQVLDGARLSAPEIVIGSGFGRGELLVDGIGALVITAQLKIADGAFYRDVFNDLTDRAEFGEGEVTILNGGEVRASETFVGLVPFGQGRLIVSGPGSKLETQHLILGARDPSVTNRPGPEDTNGVSASAVLKVENGGLVNVATDLRSLEYSSHEIQHSIEVRGVGSELRVPNSATVLENVFTEVSQGGRLAAKELHHHGNSMFRIKDSGSIVETDKFALGLGATSGHAEIIGGGTLRIATGLEMDLRGGRSTLLIEGANSSLELQSGYILAGVREPFLTNTNIETFVGAPHIIVRDGATLRAPEIFLGPFAQLSGAGGTVIGNVYSVGLISPGSSPGTLTIQGNLTLLGGSNLRLEIGGLAPGVSHDRLVITGDLTLDGGAIEFAFINGFAPQAGQTFEFLDVTGAIAGAAEFVSSGLEPGWEYAADFDPETGGLTLTSLNDGIAAVPEPASVLLLLCGGILALFSRRVFPRTRG
jgi:T5SS/PEP-CTERM-associated repeat protein